MEEMMMINTTNQENPSNYTSIQCQSLWKLYENPFFITQLPQDDHVHPNLKQIDKFEILDMVSELEYERKECKKLELVNKNRQIQKPEILNLVPELEYERKEREKLELVNKKLARDLSEERKNREAYESLCEKLAEEISANKSEIDRLKKDIEEERKMLAEVLREERVQMKLSEAKHFLEEKMTKSNVTSTSKNQENIRKIENEEKITTPFKGRVDCSSGEGRKSCLTEKSTMTQRRRINEIDNPHIRRGINGFVEYPKVIRAMGSKSLRHSGDKLECQKAQIRMILKQRSPLKTNNNIIITS